MTERHDRLRTFIRLMTHLIRGTPQRKSVRRYEHHVRRCHRRALKQRAIKLRRRQMGGPIREHDAAQWVVRTAQLAPRYEIARSQDRVNTRRPVDHELKCSNRLSYPGELNGQRVS